MYTTISLKHSKPLLRYQLLTRSIGPSTLSSHCSWSRPRTTLCIYGHLLHEHLLHHALVLVRCVDDLAHEVAYVRLSYVPLAIHVQELEYVSDVVLLAAACLLEAFAQLVDGHTPRVAGVSSLEESIKFKRRREQLIYYLRKGLEGYLMGVGEDAVEDVLGSLGLEICFLCLFDDSFFSWLLEGIVIEEVWVRFLLAEWYCLRIAMLLMLRDLWFLTHIFSWLSVITVELGRNWVEGIELFLLYGTLSSLL